MQGLGEKGDVYDNTERKTKITFDDIAGLDEEKDELKELVKFLSQLDRDELRIKSLVVEFWLDNEQIKKEGITLTEFSIN